MYHDNNIQHIVIDKSYIVICSLAVTEDEVKKGLLFDIRGIKLNMVCPVLTKSTKNRYLHF